MSVKLGTTTINGIYAGSGGGGATYTAGNGIDITNDTISLIYDEESSESSESYDHIVNADKLEGYSLNNLLKLIYPVGAIYMSTANVSPATFISGTTWVQVKDTFLLSAGDTYTAGATGGEATHTLTTNEMPAHQHEMPANPSIGSTTNTSSGRIDPWMTVTQYGSAKSKSVGGGGAHNNMPPYLVVYMWERTA